MSRDHSLGRLSVPPGSLGEWSWEYDAAIAGH